MSNPEEPGFGVVEIDDTNRAPEFPDLDDKMDGDQTDQEREIPENTAAVQDIGDPVVATDPNVDSLTYSLGGTDGASFNIARSSGQLQTKASLNREEKDTHMVTVTATDPSGLSATVNVTIKVTNVDENPTLTGPASPRVAENTPTTTAVATYVAMDDEDDNTGTAIRWSLDGENDEDFSITGGVLRFKSAPNYEAQSTYSIMVVATDSDEEQPAELTVTVTVTNVDEAGTLTLSTLQPVDGIEMTTILTDIDGVVVADETTWKWAKSSSRTGAYTDIEGETANSYTPKPADLNHYLRGTATYTDPQGSGKTAVATTANKMVVSRSTNTPPVFKDADDREITNGITREVAENTPKGVVVGAPVAATDSEGDVLTYTLSGTDAGSFSIDVATGQLRTSAALNEEVKDDYMVMVTATDPSFTEGVDNDVITVTINVTNVDEDPKLTGPASARVAENTANTVAIATTDYAATDDEDGDANVAVVLTLSGTDAAAFSLDAGEVTFKAVPNFEAPKDAGKDNVYNITVVATDSDGQTDEMGVTVTVTNVEEGGTVTLSPLQPRIGSPVTATLSDIDGAVSDVKWKWARSANQNAGDFVDIDGATAASYTPVTADDMNYLRATASYTDPEGSDTAMSDPAETGFMMVEIDDTNRAPKFPDLDDKMDGAQTDQGREIAENTDAGEDVGDGVMGDVPVTATDPNMDSLTYSLGGTDGASFSIVRNTGQLQTKASLNREEQDTHMVTVTATDPSGLSATVNVTIKITDMPEPPVIMRAPDANVAPEFASATTSRTVAEDTAAGENIGTPVQASDANRDTLTYALGGTDAASFGIDTGSGQLMTKAALDYQAKASYEVTVTATDPEGASDMITVTITATEVDDMVGPAPAGPVGRYDVNNSGRIDKDELADGVFDYNIEQTLSKDDLADLVFSYEIG